MKISHFTRYLIIAIVLVMLLGMPGLITGCTAAISGTAATEMAATRVPPVDLDVYIYVNQQVPTIIPKSLTGSPADISVQSVAIWGIANTDTQYTVAGALNFTNAADAGAVFSQISNLKNIYTKMTDRTIYFLQGSGGPAESIKNAIDNDNFKQYDDKTALGELSRLPSGGTTIPGVIGIVKPSNAAVNLVKQYLDQNTANTISSIYSSAKPRIIALGVFGSQPLNLADMAQRIVNSTIWDMDLGVVVSMDSVYPGFIFGPIASRVISDQGFPEVKVGDENAYKDSLNLADGKTIPAYLNISGNHVYATVSGNDAYARTLLTKIKR